MNPQLEQAIRDRVALGYEAETILAELQAAGYGADQARSAVEEVVAAMAETVSSAPDSVPQDEPLSAQGEQQVVDSSRTGAVRSWFSGTALLVAGLILVVVASATALAATGAWRYVSDSLFSFAPYTEANFIPGIMHSFDSFEQYTTAGKVSIELEPRGDAPSGLDDLFTLLHMQSMMLDMPIPERAHLRFTSIGSVDARDKDSLKFDIESIFEFSFDEMSFTIPLNIRSANDEMFMQLPSVPPVLKALMPFLEDGAWIQTMSHDEMMELQQAAVPSMAPLLTVWRSQPMAKSVPFNQAASLPGAIGVLPGDGGASAEMAHMWREYPPLRLQGRPQRVSLEGQTVYEYQLVVDPVTAPQFVKEYDRYMAAQVQRGEMASVPMLYQEMFDQETIDFLTQGLSMVIRVRTDGTIHSATMELKASSADPSIDRQIVVLYDVSWQPVSSLKPIEAPSQYSTWAELTQVMEDERMQAQLELVDARIKSTVSNLRGSAEIHANNNMSVGSALSYDGFCTSVQASHSLGRIEQLYSDLGVEAGAQCVTSGDNYVIIAPLVSEEGATCVDSKGSGQVVSLAMITDIRDRMSCQTPDESAGE